MKYLAKNLKWLRKRKELSQGGIEEFIGIKRSAWSNYELGVSKPGLDDMIRISKFFGYSETEILHTDLEGDRKSEARPYLVEEADPALLAESVAEYKRLCDLKDQTIAAQQGQIEALTIIANRGKGKKRKTPGKKM